MDPTTSLDTQGDPQPVPAACWAAPAAASLVIFGTSTHLPPAPPTGRWVDAPTFSRLVVAGTAKSLLFILHYYEMSIF